MTGETYDVVTCADAGFFHFLPFLEENVRRKTGRYPIIYDLGMTDRQVRKLKSDVVSINAPDGYADHLPSGPVRTTHKPACLLDAMQRSTNHLLYIDADVMMVDCLPDEFWQGADIAVTPRHPNEMKSADPFSNGRINAGVIFVANRPASEALLTEWAAACEEPGVTDQMALSRLLEESELEGGLGTADIGAVTVAKLDPREFNDVAQSTGRLWHFKNAGRRLSKKRRWLFSALKERWMPNTFAAKARARRRELAPFGRNRDRARPSRSGQLPRH